MNKKYLNAVLGLLVLVAGLAAALFLVKQSQEIRRRAQLVSDVSVSLSPQSQTIAVGQKTTISLVLTNTTSPGRDINLYAAEADLQFDPSSLTVSNLACNSSFLSSAAVATVSGDKISLSCFAPGGSGTRTITSGGQATLGSFDITSLDKTGASQISITRANVPDATTFADLSGGGGTGGSYTIAAVGGPLPTETPAAGQPNACGGTCGSNYNCQAGLFCYQGFCRNPACATDSDCVCATPKPKAKPKVTPTATPSLAPAETPMPISLASPLVEEIATPFPTPTPEAEKPRATNLNLYLAISGLILLLVAIVFLVLRKVTKNEDISQMKPPETPPFTPPPQTPPTQGPTV